MNVKCLFHFVVLPSVFTSNESNEMNKPREVRQNYLSIVEFVCQQDTMFENEIALRLFTVMFSQFHQFVLKLNNLSITTLLFC